MIHSSLLFSRVFVFVCVSVEHSLACYRAVKVIHILYIEHEYAAPRIVYCLRFVWNTKTSQPATEIVILILRQQNDEFRFSVVIWNFFRSFRFWEYKFGHLHDDMVTGYWAVGSSRMHNALEELLSH